MSNIKSLRIWKDISKPKKSILFWQFITATIPAALNILIAIPSANLISSLSVFDYRSAKVNLFYIVMLTILCFIFWNINHLIYPKQINYMYKQTYESIFHKIISISDESLKVNSKERMIHILSNNLHNTIEFTNIISIKFAYLFTSIVMISIVTYYNLMIGLITLIISATSYLFYYLINLKLTTRINSLQSAKDDVIENFSYVIDGKDLSADLNLTNNLKEKYDLSVKNLITNHKKEHVLKLFSDKWVYYFWKILIYSLTFYLISLVENNIFSLTIYLFLTPYLTSTIENFFEFLSVFNHLSLAKISALRIKTILDMNQEDLISFGNNIIDNIDGNIHFSNISFNTCPESEIYGSINNFSLDIKKNTCVVFKGEKKCGKKAIFYILRRKIRPSTGTITLDTINIYDFDKDTYSRNLSYVLSSPNFFNDTLINNLKHINKNQKTIKKVLHDLKIDKNIENLPNKYSTNLLKDKSVSDYLLFMIALARSILSNSEIICIYEIPQNITEDELDNIKSAISLIQKNHTIIIFTSTNKLDNLSTQIININNGNVSKNNE